MCYDAEVNKLGNEWSNQYEQSDVLSECNDADFPEYAAWVCFSETASDG